MEFHRGFFVNLYNIFLFCRAVPMFPSVSVATPPSKRNSGGAKKKRVAIKEEEER